MEQSNSGRLPLKIAYRFLEQNGFGSEVKQIQDLEIEWESSYDSTVRRGYVIDLLEQKHLLDEFLGEIWPIGLTRAGQTEIRRCRMVRDKFVTFINGNQNDEPERGQFREVDYFEFAIEAHLRDFLAKNLDRIELGLRLYEVDGRRGVEFPVDDGRIDILAIDSSERFVIVELKLSRGRNKSLGQLLYYMGWVDEHLGRGPSRGVIVASEISQDLVVAVRRVQGVKLARYLMSFAVDPVS